MKIKGQWKHILAVTGIVAVFLLCSGAISNLGEMSSYAEGAPENLTKKAVEDIVDDKLEKTENGLKTLKDWKDARFFIIVLIILLMVFFFGTLVPWANRREATKGYLGPIFSDYIGNYEYKRQIEPLVEKWDRGEYHELVRLGIKITISERWGVTGPWIKKNPKPRYNKQEEDFIRKHIHKFPDLMQEGDGGLGGMPDDPWLGGRNRRPGRTGLPPRKYGSTQNPFPWEVEIGLATPEPPSLTSSPEPPPEEPPNDDQNSVEYKNWKTWKEEYKKYEENSQQYIHDKIVEYKNYLEQRVRDWENSLHNEARRLYEQEKQDKQEEAQDRASEVLGGIDFLGIFGRGPEFILHFTALVVIIFSATMLGVIGILSGDQVGTIIAAVAGYVLGREVTRTPETTAEAKKLLPQAEIGTVDQQTTKPETKQAEIVTAVGDRPPTVSITKPVPTGDSYPASTNPISIAGKAEDDFKVTEVHVENKTTGVSKAAELGDGTTSRDWQVPGIGLQGGQNTIIAIAKDASGNSSEEATIFVIYKTPDSPDPEKQQGESNPENEAKS